MFALLNEWVQKAIRVLRVSYRPKPNEYWMIAKITALGMVLVGAIGYVLTLIFEFIG